MKAIFCRLVYRNMLLLLALAMASCGGEPSKDDSAAHSGTARASAAFPKGCLAPGTASAEFITDPGFKLAGSNALGGVGDYVLANDQAMYVVTGLGPQKTYYHYAGILVDAVAIENCEQAADDNFYEMALMLGKLNALQQSKSTFRAFNAHSLEIVNDGSDGNAAILRARGADDVYWLLELTLMGQGILDGIPKYRSQPMDFEVVVDYILEPDSPTLKVEYRVVNQRNGFNSLSIAFVLLSSGQGPTLNTFSAFDMDVSGLELQYGIPWVTASNGESSYVYTTNSSALTTTHIAGVDALLDAKQMGNTYLGSFFMPNGRNGDTLLREFFITAEKGDELKALQTHLAHAPKSFNTLSANVNGRVISKTTGQPIKGAKIEIQTKKQVFLKTWPWETFVTTLSDVEGRFGGDLPLVSYLSNQQYRVLASAPGRESLEPVLIVPGETKDITFEFNDEGRVDYQFIDQEGKPSPAQVSFYQDGKRVKRFYTTDGFGQLTLPPGDYSVSISRGFEYAIVDTDLTITPGIVAPLAATLNRMVDTTGFLSFDAHIHSAPSPDSEVSVEDRIRTAVTTGLEVVVSTDHEIITDLTPTVANLNMKDYVATVIGQEVTASIPNHTIAYPLDRDSQLVRDFVAWHGKDIGQIFAAEKAHGAQIRTFAHPRGEYLELIKWDRIKGEPGDINPAHLGLPADATIWSWDFEAMEYMNGHQEVFRSGIFEDWMSFLNHGHRIAATGASDVHDYDSPGMPRNYFKSSTDNPAEFNEGEMVAAVKNGQLVVSTGAFARVTVNGTASLGETITDTDGEVQLQVQIEAIPQIDVDHFRVYVNCDEVARIATTNPLDSALKYAGTLPIPVGNNKDAHIVVLGFGSQFLHREFDQFDPTEVPRFTTNPIYVDVNGDGVFQAPGGKECSL